MGWTKPRVNQMTMKKTNEQANKERQMWRVVLGDKKVRRAVGTRVKGFARVRWGQGGRHRGG